MHNRWLRLLAIIFAFALIAAACGDDDDGDAEDPVETDEGDGAEDPPADEGDGDAEPPAEEGEGEGDEEPPAEEGEAEGDAAPAGDFDASIYEPVGEATGDPIKIGYQNPEGDPAGSFPEASAGAAAAAAFINAELGGLGGRPIELDICTMAISPDESQRCANELAADGVELAVHSINFFGNHYPIYQGSNIPSVVGSPVTIADFTTPGVFSIGGGCLAQHTGLVQFATDEITETRRHRGQPRECPVGRHAPGCRLLLRPRGQAPRRPERHRPR
jgi:branched-chain amino acid transport system substrate-binding protein